MFSIPFSPLKILLLTCVAGSVVGGVVTSQVIVKKIAREEAHTVIQKELSKNNENISSNLSQDIRLNDISSFIKDTLEELDEHNKSVIPQVINTLPVLNLSPSDSTAGLRFLKISNASSTVSNNGKVLSIDSEGKVILVDDKDDATTHTTNNYTTTNVTQINGEVDLDDQYPAVSGETFYFNGSTWTYNSLLYNSGSRVGINTTNPLAQLHITSGDYGLPGLIVQGAAEQSVPLQIWKDNDGTTVASMSAAGKLTLGNREDDHTIEMYPVLELFPAGDAGELSSNGGALYIDNTLNYGSGINIFSNASSLADGHLLNIKVDNTTFDKGAIYVDYDGTSNGVNINHNGNTTAGNALSVTNNNPNDSALGVIGYETGRGTVKITHNGTGTDANASGLSIDVKGEGTRAQGIYVDSTATSGTLGNLLRLRNQGIDRFVVNYLGAVTMGSTGTNTSFTKLGNNVNDEFFVGTNGAFRVQRSASDSEAFRVQVAGDTQGRWLGTSDGRLKWGDGSSAQDVVLRRSAALNLLLDGSKFQIKSPALSSDLLVFTNAGNTRIGRMLETAAGHGWFEVADSSAVAKVVLRADSGLSYFNGGNVSIGTTGTAAKLQVLSTNEQLRLNYNDSQYAQFVISSAGLLTVTPTGGLHIASNMGIGGGTFGTSAANVLAIANSTAPTTAITNGIQLFAVDQAGSHELRVMDEAGNSTTLSPHNFSLVPNGSSEDLAWAFYSERNNKAINADMTKALRTLEELSGQELVFIKDLSSNSYIPNQNSTQLSLKQRVEKLESLIAENDTTPLDYDSFISKQELEQTFTWSHTVAVFIKSVVFKAHTIFEGTTEFLAGVVFKDAITVSADTAGTLIIPAGVTKMKVTFSKPMTASPQVYLTFLNTAESNPRYKLENISPGGFIVSLTEVQTYEVQIQWLALLKSEGDVQTEILESQPLPSPIISNPEAASESANL